jgi:hypothetical protein
MLENLGSVKNNENKHKEAKIPSVFLCALCGFKKTIKKNHPPKHPPTQIHCHRGIRKKNGINTRSHITTH